MQEMKAACIEPDAIEVPDGVFPVPNRRPGEVSSLMDTNQAANHPEEGGDNAGSAAIGIDRADWGPFLSAHRDRLRRMVALRLDHRLPDDVFAPRVLSTASASRPWS